MEFRRDRKKRKSRLFNYISINDNENINKKGKNLTFYI